MIINRPSPIKRNPVTKLIATHWRKRFAVRPVAREGRTLRRSEAFWSYARVSYQASERAHLIRPPAPTRDIIGRRGEHRNQRARTS